MSDIKITDLVDQGTIDKIKELNTEMQGLVTSYTNTAKELAKGLDINVRVIGDIDKLDKLLIEKTKEAAATTEKLNEVIAKKDQVIANTTNTISRQLMEQERINKTQREAYIDTESFKKLLEQVNGSYENRVKRLVETNQAIAANKKQQDDLKKSLDMGRISQEQYNQRLVELTMAERELKQTKADLTTHLKNEEREMQSVEGSYKNLSQRLELMKKAYKDLTEEERSSPLGKEMEGAIQNLDAHLKDVAADMGEFQRNVGNYAIAGQNGVVATESLVAVMNQQAVTIKDVADQNKILLEGRSMLDTSDANYATIVALINDKLAENSRRLADVSDIMEVHATTIAEAEAQNKRLQEALKQVDQTSEEAQETIEDLNAKIEENNKIIEAGSESKQSIKTDLKELVLEIANLSLEYQNLSEEEKASAEGQELADHINELIEQAGALKDAIADTNQAISNAASDTRGFDQLGGTLQLAIDGFGLATGAAEMLGISSEDLASIQTKLQAAIAASNAMQSIQNTLQAQSAVMQGVNLVQTKLRTVAENLHTAAQGKGVVATGALTAAQWAFNAAANANPIGLLVVAIVAAIAAVWGLCKAFAAFFGPSDEALEAYAEHKKALEDLCEANDKLIDRMKARGATEAELLEQSLLNKQAEQEAADRLFAEAKELYDEDEDEYKEALEAKKKADEEFEKQKEDSLNYLLSVIHESEEAERKERLGTYEYKRQLILAELKHQKAIAASLLAQAKITRQIYENLCASLDKAAQFKINTINTEEQKDKEREQKRSSRGNGSGSNGINDAQKRAQELKKAVQEGEDAMLKLIADGLERQRQEEILSYNRQLKELQESLAKCKDTEIKMRTSIIRQIEGLTVEHDRKMYELQMNRNERTNRLEAEFIASHLSIVKEGSSEELGWKLKAVENQYQAELLAVSKTENEKTITQEQAEEMRANLAIKYADLREKTEEEYAEKQAEIIAKRYAADQSARDNAMMSELNDQKRVYLERIKTAKGNTKMLESIEEDYNEECIEIQERYAEESARKAMEMIEETLKMDKLSAEEREQFERDLAKAKMDLETLMADHAIAQMKRIEEKNKKDAKGRIEAVAKWVKVAQDAMNQISELVSAVYDGKIQKIEEEQEINTAASEEEQSRITELVNKKVITEEEGEARKRAAEAQTAKKNEEIEKKKADMQRKQAIFNKAISAMNVGLNTAVALMRLWVEPGWPAAMPMMAVVGALGALELATVLATPIPKYAKGTDYHKGGPAIVGDGGKPEVILFNGNAWMTPDKPTLVDIPSGASVLPDLMNMDDMIPGIKILPVSERKQDLRSYDDSGIRRGVNELAYLIRMQTRIQHRDVYLAQYELFKSRF